MSIWLGTKDPAYSDVLYVEELIAPDVINTMPAATLRAFAHHGDATRTFDLSGDAAAETLRRARDVGIDLPAVTAQLERAGVRSYSERIGAQMAARSVSSSTSSA